ncbi:hypothetical protein Nepgr_012430 [Nepenthes gracilis]|uniref:Uncharacterized protein n=1 Tax=Nepenthes gracilis TaxID=150966 RepID=A0AAD3XN47_NEPGR|nr:hypothetical protein Nepgr_012430 [Nepenthes gracilis]
MMSCLFVAFAGIVVWWSLFYYLWSHEGVFTCCGCLFGSRWMHDYLNWELPEPRSLGLLDLKLPPCCSREDSPSELFSPSGDDKDDGVGKWAWHAAAFVCFQKMCDGL